MSDVRATTLRKVMAVERTADGKAVVFAFEDIKGGRHVFAMPAHEIAELVGKFVKAAKTVRRTGETPLAPVVDNFEVAGSIAERQVILTLTLTASSAMEFVLSPALAESLSEALGIAAAKLVGKPIRQN